MTGPIPWELTDQEYAVEVLSQAIQSEDYGHAWAFVGPSGVGQERTAKLFAAAVNGAIDSEKDLNRFIRGSHPAYRMFIPSGASYLKSDVNDGWLPAASQTLIEGKYKILHIRFAEKMNIEAANAFLKTLEEPPDRTIWILDIANEQSLPDTIMSRCRRVPFQPWSKASLNTYAASLGINEGNRDLIVNISEGAPEKVSLLANEQALIEYKQARSVGTRVLDHGPAVALIFTHELKAAIKRRGEDISTKGKEAIAGLNDSYGDKPPAFIVKTIDEQYKRLARAEQTNTIQDALDAYVGWLRDICAVSANPFSEPVDLRNIDAKDEVYRDANRVSLNAALAICDEARKTRDALEVNVAWELALQAFILRSHSIALTS